MNAGVLPSSFALQSLAVMLGASLGAWLRWRVGVWLATAWPVFPLGTLLVNAVGGFLIGFLLVALGKWPAPAGEANELWRLLLITGFLGGLTTFSAFSGESLSLLMRGEAFWALAHTLAHVLGALLCAAVGMALAKALLN